MSVLKNFKNTPRSPYGGAICPRCNFFSSNLQRGPWPKKMKGGHVAPPQWATRGGLSPPLGRPVAPAHRRGRGPVAPLGRPGYPPLYKDPTPIPSSFEPENSTKNPEKKRGVRRRKVAKPCRIPHL